MFCALVYGCCMEQLTFCICFANFGVAINLSRRSRERARGERVFGIVGCLCFHVGRHDVQKAPSVQEAAKKLTCKNGDTWRVSGALILHRGMFETCVLRKESFCFPSFFGLRGRPSVS